MLPAENHLSQKDLQAMDARRMFNRVLASWAMDVLALKKRNLDRPSLRHGSGLRATAHLSAAPARAATPRPRRAA
ncbi:MAG TPA: hypothetical protein PK308_09940 [Phycisphaerales bacterium]|nr:hypothetical protein [Phycisphaerales bacterium]